MEFAVVSGGVPGPGGDVENNWCEESSLILPDPNEAESSTPVSLDESLLFAQEALSASYLPELLLTLDALLLD